MKTAYTTHGLLLADKDLAIVAGNNHEPIEIEVPEHIHLIQDDTVYMTGDFNHYDSIEVTFSFLNEKIDIVDVSNSEGYFIVGVDMSEGEDPVCSIENRNFKLEHLSMELQERIHKTANEMYIDWLKVKED